MPEGIGCQTENVGPRGPATLTSINNLASLLHITGRHDDAERLCRDVLEVYERNHPGHPDTLKTISNLAALLMTRGRFDEAESLNRQTLESSGVAYWETSTPIH